MKITDVQTILVNVEMKNWVFVKVFTDEGITGLGEATLEDKALTVKEQIENYKDKILGEDPFNIEKIWQKLYYHGFWRGGVVMNTAVSGIEHALWDIMGKKLDVPVYKLLGGKYNDKIPVYATSRVLSGETIDECLEYAQDLVDRGFTAFKGDPFGNADRKIGKKELDWAMEKIRAVKKEFDDDLGICIEGHGRFNVDTAIKIARRLEEFDPLFFEEPVPPENVDVLLKVSKAANVTIATGERKFTKFDYREVLEKQPATIIQPDICHTGGILELKKIAAMAEARYIPVAPHNPNGPVATAANIHVMATIPNIFRLEYLSSDVPWRDELLVDPIEFEDGYVKIPERPGLGVELNEDVVREHPYKKAKYALFS
ncbi:MAG: galactonate dehydratase [bacterium]